MCHVYECPRVSIVQNTSNTINTITTVECLTVAQNISHVEQINDPHLLT